MIFPVSVFIGAGAALQKPWPNISCTESVGANFVRFYCSLISSMNVLIG